MIFPIFKPLGQSSHQLAAAIGAKSGEKATHTGTLDPMAEGVLVVLTGEDRFQKAQLSDTKKTYSFEMLFGISTDSLDLLGLPIKIESTILDPDTIRVSLTKKLPDFLGTQKQLQPIFSAGRSNGKSFFEYGKSGEALPAPKSNEITVYSLELTKCARINREKILTLHSKKIGTVLGEFRQDEILAAWHNITSALPSTVVIATLTAEVSKRTYIRGLVRDISTAIDIPATTFSIIRTQNGRFGMADCRQIESI